MKKIFCAVCILFSAAFFLNAEQDNGKLFPSREHYSIENIFYGFSGIFDFPNTFYNNNLSAMTGAGGGFSAEIGYNWSGWMLSAEYLRDIWATKNAAFVRLEKSRNNIFQLRIRRVLSNKTISKFPEWFSLVPGFGAGMNFMQGDYYATQRDKDLGNYKHIDFHDREGHSFTMRFSIEAAFDIFKNSEFIPFVGIDYNLVFNERISGGISGYPRMFLGFRRYPFKNADRLQRFKKLLDWDQIKVTEKPPMEPHLRALDDGSRVFYVQPGDDYAGDRNANQSSEDEDLLLEDDFNDDLYIGKEKDSETPTDETSDDEDKDVYNDDSDKKEDYYLPKDDDDNKSDDNELEDTQIGAGGMPTLKVSTSLRDGFTPDGDGINDTVDFMFESTGLEYTPESWSVQVVDDAGNVVKTWSGTGDMPEKITWDGITDSGALVAPDKEYSVVATAIPDARDKLLAGIGMVTDAGTFRTGGTARAGDDGNIGDGATGAGGMPTLKVSTSLRDGFTPDGDGINDTVDFMFESTGLEYTPESWTVQVVDDAGKVVKTWKGTGDMPEKITWDGITDRGTLVDPNKEYSVVATAIPDARDKLLAGISMVTDAGSFRTGGTARIVDDGNIGGDAAGAVTMPTLKVSTSLSDGFTPDGDGIDDTVDFMFESNGLEYPPESWTVQIVDDDGNVVKTWSGTGDMPEKITWDGITDSGALVDMDKEYSVVTTAVPDARDTARAGIGMVTDANSFRTGNATRTGDDGDIGDDAAGAVAMPTLKVSTSISDGFTPDGDGIDDTVDFMFEATGLEYPPESWTVQIIDDAGNVVKTWSGTGDMPEKITWDGITDSGALVDMDKEYSVVTTAVPDARDTDRAGIGIVTDANSFRTGNATRTGDDGDISDDAAGVVVMPTLKVSTSLSDGFTPDGDGIDDTVDFMFEATGLEYPPESWTVQIVDDAGNVVKTWSDDNDNVPEKITWNGVTDDGELVRSNTDYAAIISVTPDERDTARTGITAVTDTDTFRTGNLKDTGLPVARLLMSYSDGLSPDGDGKKDTVDFTFKTHGLEYAPESWKLEIFDPVDNLVRTWSGKGELPESITWDGTTDNGDIVAALSNYPIILSVIPDAREREQIETGMLVDRQVMRTGIIIIDETDKLQPKDLPEETQPAEEKDNTTSASDEQPVEEELEPKQDEPQTPVSDEQPAEKETETSKDETPAQEVKEPVGSESEPETPIPGTTRKQWRLISVPVYFDPDAATFNLISETNRQSNIRVLNKIAAEIKKYGNSAMIIIEGHANNVSNTEREHIEELIPLSQERAEVVKQLLIERGIDAEHLTAEGVGGSSPLAEWTDRRNWWQNRRVEFIISVEE